MSLIPVRVEDARKACERTIKQIEAGRDEERKAIAEGRYQRKSWWWRKILRHLRLSEPTFEASWEWSGEGPGGFGDPRWLASITSRLQQMDCERLLRVTAAHAGAEVIQLLPRLCDTIGLGEMIRDRVAAAETTWTCFNCRYRGPDCHDSDYADDEIRCPTCGCPEGDGFGMAANDPNDPLYGALEGRAE